MKTVENLGKYVVVNVHTGNIVEVNNKTTWHRKSDASLTINNWWRALVRATVEYTEAQVIEALGGYKSCTLGTAFKFNGNFYFKSSQNTFFVCSLFDAKYAAKLPFEVREIKAVEIN